LRWKDSASRKPLILRGARQVGKTTIVREFAKEFHNYIELNLERRDEYDLFKEKTAAKILSAAFLLKGKKPNKKSTLLFIDEIQESPTALKMLRYFYEDMPELHVIAAGSLLEFALKSVPSFPVGRVDYLYMYPLNFEEYLAAIDNQQALALLKEVPIPGYAHNIMLDLFHTYAIIGGMPEIVKQYVTNNNHMASLGKYYKNLWQSYKDDVEKYARNDSEKHIIRHIIQSAPLEKDRVSFERFGNSNYRSREVGDALRALDQAGVIQLIYPTTNIDIPLMPDLKKRPRLQFVDTGMLNQILMLQGEMLLVKDLNNIYRGRLIQHLVNQELISVHQDMLYKPKFWVREKKESSAEVDLIYQSGKYLIPIEAKSGKQGKLRSLHQFVKVSPHDYAVRLFAGRFNMEKATTPQGYQYTLMNIPYYLGTQIPQYVEYFLGLKQSS